MATEKVRGIGGWDAAFCDGVGYDDNDFALRLLLAGMSYRWEDRFLNVHEAHRRYGGRNWRKRYGNNKALWLRRLHGYDGGLWPITGFTEPPLTVVGDGLPEQTALRDSMSKWGYPGSSNPQV